ncbi:flagellar protein FliT [Clostridium drakei]|uniref:Flagellar protein FliT n=1 Tax=Clostridium drakei TaxID=332101 RepID=A0A2U8DNB0_9CLOT|nr:flagellar protein FliT [Clostridium drakei]AWI03672.1 flagellar protein FliT [Clostridium drakei]
MIENNVNEILKEALTKYKNCTLQLIEAVEKEDYDILQIMLDERQEIIDSMSNIEYTKEQFVNFTEELNIVAFQKKLTELMYEKRNNLKKELSKISNSRIANKSYNSRLYQTTIFNKRF